MSYETTIEPYIGVNVGFNFYDDYNNSVEDEDGFYEKFQEDPENPLQYLYEGMFGEYFIIGFNLRQYFDFEFDSGENFGNLEDFLQEHKARLVAEVKSLIKKYHGLDVEPKFGIIAHTA